MTPQVCTRPGQAARPQRWLHAPRRCRPPPILPEASAHHSHYELLAVLPWHRFAEVLDVRWANDDPNPRAVQRVQADREGALRDAYTKVLGWWWRRCGVGDG